MFDFKAWWNSTGKYKLVKEDETVTSTLLIEPEALNLLVMVTKEITKGVLDKAWDLAQADKRNKINAKDVETIFRQLGYIK